MKDSATQLLTKYKSGALVTQNDSKRPWDSVEDLACPVVLTSSGCASGKVGDGNHNGDDEDDDNEDDVDIDDDDNEDDGDDGDDMMMVAIFIKPESDHWQPL